MDTNYIFAAIAFTIIFIILDVQLFSYRKKKKIFEAMKPFITIILSWKNKLFAKFPKPLIKINIRDLFPKNIPSPNPAHSTPDEAKTLPIDTSSSDEYSLIKNPENQDQNMLAELAIESLGNKIVHIQISADIPEGTVVHVTLKVEDGRGEAFIQKSPLVSDQTEKKISVPVRRVSPDQRMGARVSQWAMGFFNRFRTYANDPEKYLVLVAIIIYALIVGFQIDRYPIYFFTDEAAHMNLAANFLRDGFTNYFGEFLPTFFTTEGWVNGTSVYLQVLPLVLFGKSVLVTRLVSAFFSMLGALAVSLLLRDTLKLKNSWAGIFMVLTTPAWFLHARTAFEYVEVASFYSLFLYFYSRYRSGRLQSLYWAIIAGALAFYTHGLGQILMGLSGLIFFVVDFRYHIHPDQRKTVQNGLLLGLVFLLPFARYYLAHPGEAAEQVKRRGSYWSDGSLSITQKLSEFFRAYSYGMNPAYWFAKNSVDLSRHTMKGYGNGLWFTLPFLAIGLFQAIKNIRLPSYRIILISLLVCPIPASVVAIGMPRMLWVTIPIALITTIGISTVLAWLEARLRIHPILITAGLFVALVGLSTYMLRDALVNGPTWFEDYSLYGMQYGAEQVFRDVVKTGLDENPNRLYIVSPSWANGTEQFVEFFIPEELRSRLKMGQPINYISDIRKGSPELYTIATSDEYDKLMGNPEFKDITIHQILDFPNKKPGFYVLTLKVAENIEEILAAEHEKNRTPVEDTIPVNGIQVRILHSPLGSGRVDDVFDNNPDSLARVLDANPFIFDLYPETPINTNSINIQTGSLTSFTVNVSLYAPNTNDPIKYTQTFTNLAPDPKITMTFENGPVQAARVFIEIRDDTSGDTSQIHVRTIEIK